jgi:hypothetical protein
VAKFQLALVSGDIRTVNGPSFVQLILVISGGTNRNPTVFNGLL